MVCLRLAGAAGPAHKNKSNQIQLKMNLFVCFLWAAAHSSSIEFNKSTKQIKIILIWLDWLWIQWSCPPSAQTAANSTNQSHFVWLMLNCWTVCLGPNARQHSFQSILPIRKRRMELKLNCWMGWGGNTFHIHKDNS